VAPVSEAAGAVVVDIYEADAVEKTVKYPLTVVLLATALLCAAVATQLETQGMSTA
jgi:hypothetical protein